MNRAGSNAVRMACKCERINPSGAQGHIFDSPAIKVQGSVLHFSSKEITKRTSLDLNLYVFPPNDVHLTRTTILDHPALLNTLCRTLDKYSLKAGDSKSHILLLRRLANDVVKILECGWVAGFHRFEDWTPEFFRRIIEKYAEIGGAHV